MCLIEYKLYLPLTFPARPYYMFFVCPRYDEMTFVANLTGKLDASLLCKIYRGIH